MCPVNKIIIEYNSFTYKKRKTAEVLNKFIRGWFPDNFRMFKIESLAFSTISYVTKPFFEAVITVSPKVTRKIAPCGLRMCANQFKGFIEASWRIGLLQIRNRGIDGVDNKFTLDTGLDCQIKQIGVRLTLNKYKEKALNITTFPNFLEAVRKTRLRRSIDLFVYSSKAFVPITKLKASLRKL